MDKDVQTIDRVSVIGELQDDVFGALEALTRPDIGVPALNSSPISTTWQQFCQIWLGAFWCSISENQKPV
ncbi:MAG: hypothetical protein ACKVH1_04025 [Alphaproteobacteria bacterium]